MQKKISIKTKQQQNIANNTSIQDLISHLNDGKWQTLTMMQLNVVHVDTGKILFCNNFHIIHIISNRLFLQDFNDAEAYFLPLNRAS